MYATIQPPFTLDFAAMARPELKAYFAWFMKVMPERIAGLEAAVREDIPGWAADETPDSLTPLGTWFETQVELRPRTESELAELQAGLSFPIEVPREYLTNRTFSLAMDIGMYFARVILATVPGTDWSQSLKNPRLAHHGQPIVISPGKSPLNPVNLVVNLAYAIASKTQRGGPRLRELFDIWAGLLKG